MKAIFLKRITPVVLCCSLMNCGSESSEPSPSRDASTPAAGFTGTPAVGGAGGIGNPGNTGGIGGTQGPRLTGGSSAARAGAGGSLAAGSSGMVLSDSAIDGSVAIDSAVASGGSGPTPPTGECNATIDRVRITEIDVGVEVVNNEDEARLMPLFISPIPSGGSRVAWMGNDYMVHVVQLDSADQISGPSVAIAAHDYSDIYADESGGVLLLTRDAEGGGNNNCGTLSNLCGSTLPSAEACYDMYMVRFDGSSETWAAKLTESSASLPPYSTGPTGPNVTYIWWYAHHGRIAYDGSRWAGYYGAAISTSQRCTNGGGTNGVGINIHQGDQMRIVDANGAIQSGGFNWGCSHSGYERVVWDPSVGQFIAVCKTDNANRIAFAPRITTIYPVDLAASNMSNIVLAGGGGYWIAVSNARPGASGMADVHLIHFSSGEADNDIVLASEPGINCRAPHLARYGSGRMLAAWETSTATGDLGPRDNNRKLVLQTLDDSTGAAEGEPYEIDIQGNRYQEFRAFPDGSVAYPAPGSNNRRINIVRVLPCNS